MTFPKQVIEDLGLKPGDSIQLEKTKDGYVLRPRWAWLDEPPPLRGRIPADYPDFDLEELRSAKEYLLYRD